MSKIKKIILVIVISAVLLTIGISVGENESKLRTNYQVIEDAQLSVNVEGVEEGHRINLYDPEGEILDQANVSSEDIVRRFIGVVQGTFEFSLADEGNPVPGEYTLEVRDPNEEEKIYEENITFEGYDIDITDFKVEYDEDRSEMLVDVENSGDLPIFTDEMKLEINQENETLNLTEPKELMPETTTELNESVDLDIEEGDHDVSLKLFSFGDILVTYEGEVEISY